MFDRIDITDKTTGKIIGHVPCPSPSDNDLATMRRMINREFDWQYSLTWTNEFSPLKKSVYA